MNNDSSELYFILFICTIFFACLASFIVYFIILYKNKQVLHQQEQEQLQANFSQELLKTQIEVQEQTLNDTSREIHDNITQVLSFVKLNLAMIGNINEQQKQAKINESRELVAQVINDLRNLSKSLSFEHIAALGLTKTLTVEAERINASGLLKADLLIDGDSYSLGEQRELVLFRIFQESLNNTLKHANAKHLKISLQYSKQLFNLIVEDDGNGFSPGEINNGGGAGLKNMQNRSALIGAVISIDSFPGKGCLIKVTLQQDIYTDGNYPDSIG